MKPTAFSYTNKKGQKYFLHELNVSLKNGRKQVIYFFARDERKGTLEEVPQGWEVFETIRTGMPVLRKVK